MKVAFIIYHEVLEDRITETLNGLKIDYFTEWENVKGKGHQTDAHMGTRTFPGYNCVRMIAFPEEATLHELIYKVYEMNEKIEKVDDKIRLFQMPLERIV
jgi:hypothetical protein